MSLIGKDSKNQNNENIQIYFTIFFCKKLEIK